MDSASILDIPMGENDAEATTIRDYLKSLLRELWREGESFSGKHPFGSSDWEYELIEALIRAGLTTADADLSVAYGLISDAIEAL